VFGPAWSRIKELYMSDYWVRVSELSDDFAAKKNAADEYWKEHPELNGEGERDEYWNLQNAAMTAAIRWQEYCTANKHLR
jgi:hypothetical protein